jgi:hypothetical protein
MMMNTKLVVNTKIDLKGSEHSHVIQMIQDERLLRLSLTTLSALALVLKT